MSKRNFKNGKEEGLWERFFDNGQLQEKRNIENGEMDGIWEYFDYNGVLTTVNYKDGELVE